MSRYLLDTGIVVRHLRGNRRIVALLRGLGCTDRLGITAVTRLEIHVGMHEDERYATQKLLSRFVTYDLTAEVVDRAGDFMRTSRRGGQVVSILDAIIAATAVQHNLTLVTLNQKDFAAFSGLSLYPLETN